MISIHNIYYMLAYAFQVLKEKGYSDLATEEFSNIQNLFASILAKGISNQIKRGLGREYLSVSESLVSPRGKIDISQTVNGQLLIKKQALCEYDVFSENTYLNQILKTSASILVRSNDVDADTKKTLKKSLLFFSNVKIIDIRRVNWSALTYNRNNAAYKMLMNICYLLAKGLLITEQSGKDHLATFLDDQYMHRLYEKFILEYYKKHYPFLRPSASYISWDTDDGIIGYLPAMKSDISLCFDQKQLIIDAKYYGSSMQTGMYNKKTVHSNHLYQIYAYVKNKDVSKSGNVSGLILYAKTDEELIPNFEYGISGNRISVQTLDLDVPFEKVAEQLDNIISAWFPPLAERKID